jgi:ribose 1,5-bisphosphokinase
MGRGHLFFVVGDSGSGKDSIMKYAAEKYPGPAKVKIAHRAITRPPSPETEDFESVSHIKFYLERLLGRFTFLWKSYDKWYGIRKSEVEPWLAQGNHMLANVSRQILFKVKYPQSHIIQIYVPLEILKARLERRGREGSEEIKKRLKRAEEEVALPEGHFKIENSGTIEQAGKKLISIIQKESR